VTVYANPYAHWTRTSDPSTEPISLAEAKLHARINQETEDALIASYIKTAREEAEDYMSRGLITQTWQLALDCFYETMVLPMAAPLQSVTTVQYYDINGTLQTASSTLYDVDTLARPGRIHRAATQTWPTLQADRRIGRVLITYVVGFANDAAVPERIKQGIRLYVGYLIDDREGMEADGAKAVAAARSCWSDRVRWIAPTSDQYPWWVPDARWTA
jgi:uncharacterized phiE125 gp8 family phage protein